MSLSKERITSLGIAKGRLSNNGKVAEFLGLPYGKQERLEPSNLVDHWENGCVDATVAGPSSIQPLDMPYVSTEQPQGENCLTLNIRTPGETGDRLPVLVFIHGGGFFLGSANEPYSDTSNLAVKENLVVVSINYRLDVLGFLYMPGVCDGNLGLLDQQVALRWIQREITAFGGDPNAVTLAGESAGSASVSWHLLRPDSQPLFQRAICHSGDILASWAAGKPVSDRLAATQSFLTSVGCTKTEPNEIKQFLKKLPSEKFQRNTSMVMSASFGPIDVTGELQHFEGVNIDKPILINQSAYEGDIILSLELPPEQLEHLKENPNADLVSTLIKEFGEFVLPKNELHNLDVLAERYIKVTKSDTNALWGFHAVADFMGDATVVVPLQNFIDKILVHQPCSVYSWIFDYRGETKCLTDLLPDQSYLRCSHCFETLFIFGQVEANGSAEDLKIEEKLQKLVGDFIRTGTTGYSKEDWPEYRGNPNETITFGTKVEVNEEYNRKKFETLQFWNDLM